MNAKQDALFDIMESESLLNIFIDKAQKAAIIIIGSPVGHWPKRREDTLTLWFGRGIERDSFKDFDGAADRAIKIMLTADKDHDWRFEGPYSKEFEKIWGKHQSTFLTKGDEK